MSVFVIFVRSRHDRTCHCCAAPAEWELYGSNRPSRKLGACDAHREEARQALEEALGERRSLWKSRSTNQAGV